MVFVVGGWGGVNQGSDNGVQSSSIWVSEWQSEEVLCIAFRDDFFPPLHFLCMFECLCLFVSHLHTMHAMCK